MIHDFATWAPLLRLVHVEPGGHVAGQVGRGSWSVPTAPRSGRMEDMRAEFDAVKRVQDALGGRDSVEFVAQAPAPGRLVLHVLDRGPAVEDGLGPYPGSLVFADGAVPEPWRRLPAPGNAAPAPTADPDLLERALREQLPDAVGASEAEVAAVEARLGVTLPDELRTLYRVTRSWWEWSLDEVYVADAASRSTLWRFAATEAIPAPTAETAVQQLAGSPGWIVFADSGGGDRFAVDLTPGPAGHLGQIILIDHETNVGAELYADSLTDLVLNRRSSRGPDPRGDRPPLVARVNIRSLPSVEAAADPDLEVLGIGVWNGPPVDLAPVSRLPRLRTLTAYPGTLADPLQVAGLTGLEYLRLGRAEWRVLLDAGAVPPGLLAAGIEVQGNPNPLPVVDLANELLATRNRPLITDTVLEGDV
ncbi:SMI1/KNR4 family protein [Actinoplanes sp. NPDC024001]|uniref:SMI1/KNR4 family protein n=1 Tax=Actinoplanes sp. NPDC024001 TaxID=3154598 RepID=UPI0033FE5DB5